MATATLTKKDEYRREVGAYLADARRDLREAQLRESQAKSDLKDAKELKSGAQIRVNELSLEIQQIEEGEYQPKLFNANGHAGKGNGKAAANGKAAKSDKKSAGNLPPDAGASMPIAELRKFGTLTDKDIEKIEACPSHPKTIGELEEWMRKDELWHTKIKGMAEAGITKLQDSHLALRLQYPIPEPVEDGGKGGGKSGGKKSVKSKANAKPSANGKHPVIDRNAPGGEDCGTVAFRKDCPLPDHDAEITVAVGHAGDQTFRSSVLFRVGKVSAGRDTPRMDSPSHASQAEAARAALDELICGFQAADKKRKKIALELAKWRDAEWPDESTSKLEATTDAVESK